MIRRMDFLWFRLLGAGCCWIRCRVNAHHRRELVRRLEDHVSWQKAHLN